MKKKTDLEKIIESLTNEQRTRLYDEIVNPINPIEGPVNVKEEKVSLEIKIENLTSEEKQLMIECLKEIARKHGLDIDFIEED